MGVDWRRRVELRWQAEGWDQAIVQVATANVGEDVQQFLGNSDSVSFYIDAFYPARMGEARLCHNANVICC